MMTSALRLEATETRLAEAAVRTWIPSGNAAIEAAAGGLALFGGRASPLSQALHVGMSGAVSEAEFDRLEEFFRSRKSAVTISLCPLADASVVEHIGRRGYRISHFENTLVRPLGPDTVIPAPEAKATVRRVLADESQLWARTVMLGFSEGIEPPAETVELFSTFFDNPAGAAWVGELEGRVIAGAAMGVFDGAAMLYGDATLPEGRRCGAQALLIHTRLAHAVQAGCDLAIACTVPGSISQRNYERLGFRVAYTKVLMIKDWCDS
jgi:hypothetical protein